MARITDGDERALGMIRERYQPLLGKIISQILPSEADAEETLQDVFLEIWNRAANFDARKGKALGWIICMARRRAIDHFRRVRCRLKHVESLGGLSDQARDRMMTDVADRSQDVDQPAARDRRSLLLRLLLELPARQREAVHLIYFRQMSQREAAAYTGIPLGTIKTRLELALRKLARCTVPLRQELV